MKSALTLQALLLAALATGCGDDPASSGDGDTSVDTGGEGDSGADDDATDSSIADATQDDTAQIDVADDAGEADVTPDAPVDAASDAAPDAVADIGGVDAETDGVDLDSFYEPYADGPRRIVEIGVTVPLSDESTASATVYLPEYQVGSPFPWVIVSHGFQLQGGQYASYGQRLASHGIIAIVPSYADSLLAARTHVELANDVISILEWGLEQSASAGALQGLLDPERIGVAGHSRGGKQSIYAATFDSRIDAVFGLDPVDAAPPFGGNAADYPSVTPELMGSLTVPTGYIGTGRGSSGVPACAPSEDNYAAYFDASPSPSYSWLIPGAGHNDFVDSCEGLLLAAICRACTGGSDPDFTRTFGRATMLSFFKVYLEGDDRYQDWLNGSAVTALEGTGSIELNER